MSIALQTKVTELERELVRQRIEMMAQIAALQVRVEVLEARKPGPKPKDGANG